MKRPLKIVVAVVGILLLLALAFVAYIQFSSFPTYENKAPVLNVTSDSIKLAEGEKIVKTLCSSCHMSEDGKLGGRHMVDASAFGEVHATNITRHSEHGALSKYSDGELAYLIRTGIKRDGSYAPPWMVKLPHLSDYDMEAIISYLRSDAPELSPSNRPNQPTDYSFLAKMLVKTGAFKPMTYPSQPISGPDASDRPAYGKYLMLHKYDCFACHSKSFASCDFEMPENSKGFLGGGNPIPDTEGKIILSSNLTMDKETGLGNWTRAQFIQAVKTGARPNGIGARYPMMPFVHLSDDEVSAMWDYLQTVPVIQNSEDFSAP
ncbi:MAG: cytochrome c [Saprospiraceae bacterium]|nr:cytochrome c [Saprospiraceae bacterium]